MKRILLPIALAIACLGAQAQSADSTSNSGSVAGSNSTAGSVAGANNSVSDARSLSASTSGAVAGAGATSSADNKSGAMAAQQTSNDVGINITNPAAPTEITTRVINSGSLKTAPGFFTPAPASGPCTGTSGGVTGSWLGGGFGASLAVVDPSCTIRENLRVLTAVAPMLTGDEEKAYARNLIYSLLRAMNDHIPAPVSTPR